MVRFYSLNARGLNTPQKRNIALHEAYKAKADVLFYQETHFKRSNHPNFLNKHYPYNFHAYSKTKSKGVSILISSKLAFQQHQVIADPQGRYLMVIATIENQQYSLINLYAPNDNQLQFITRTLTSLLEYQKGSCIVAGDYNCILDPNLDIQRNTKTTTTKQQEKITKKTRDLFHKLALVDVWRAKNPRNKEFSFYSPRHDMYSRIDYILTDRQTTTTTTKAWIGLRTWSDHAPVGIETDPTNIRKHLAPWRLNETLITNTEVQNQIKTILQEYFKHNTTPDMSPQTIWLAHKATLRGELINISKGIRKQNEERQNSLEQKIKQAEITYHKNPTQKLKKQIQKDKNDLTQLVLAKTEYRLKRLKQYYYTHSNKANRLLVNKLRIQQAKHRISHLTKNNSKITDPTQIANEFASYYKNLYNLENQRNEPQPTSTQIIDYLNSIQLPHPTLPQKEYLNAPITPEEVLQVITQLKIGKAPGPDGFTNVYYKTFKNIIASHLLKTFQAIMDTGNINPEFLQAHISTIPKPGKPQDSCPNYRPIALLNTDLKLYSKILAQRLNKILPSLINNDQVGFIMNRQAPDNTRKLHNILHIIKQQKLPALILSLDAEKAFDRIHWEYMKKTLSKFQLGNTFIKAILTLYTTPTAKVNISGILSDAFKISNGTRQGCPLSPLIFALMVEPLACKIRQNHRITGVPTQQNQQNIALFADDIILTLTNPNQAVPNLMHELTEFYHISWYKINPGKTQALPINLQPQLLQTLKQTYKFEWKEKTITYLGIKIPKDPEMMFSMNYTPLQKKLQKDYHSWRSQNISWWGRITTVKMNVLPRILYIFRTVQIQLPPRYIKLLQSQMNAFIWQGKKPRIAAKVLQQPNLSGGVGIPNLLYYYKASLLETAVRMHSPIAQRQWIAIETNFLNNLTLPELLWLPPKYRPKNQSILPTTKLILQNWDTINKNGKLGQFPSPITPITNMQLLIQDLSLKQWSDKGIRTIADLYTINTYLTFQQLQEKYQIPNKEYFTYNRITNVLQKNMQNYKKKRQPTRIEQLCRIAQNGPRGILSACYRFLLELPPDHKHPFMEKWERELQIEITPEQWSSILEVTSGATRCTNHLESYKKVLYRWHLTPTKINRITNTYSPLCWKGCGHTGTLLHMWWQCPPIAELWKQVYNLITIDLQKPLPNKPEVALLLHLPEKTSQTWRKLLFHIFNTTTMHIAKHWKTGGPCDINQIKQSLNQRATMEQMAAGKENKQEKCNMIWQPWTTYQEKENNIETPNGSVTSVG
uniref:Reverse transcriptase domain-containing protein n=1 Tax=Xenopus tropicalis TaxID=8364 RepID=A0A803J5Q1_XENTR